MQAWMITGRRNDEFADEGLCIFGIFTDKGAAATRLANLPEMYVGQITEILIDADMKICMEVQS